MGTYDWLDLHNILTTRSVRQGTVTPPVVRLLCGCRMQSRAGLCRLVLPLTSNIWPQWKDKLVAQSLTVCPARKSTINVSFMVLWLLLDLLQATHCSRSLLSVTILAATIAHITFPVTPSAATHASKTSTGCVMMLCYMWLPDGLNLNPSSTSEGLIQVTICQSSTQPHV